MTRVAEARTRILDAAEQLFARHGFDATATSLIATTAEVPKGLLFYYFPAKTDILSSLIGERLGPATIDAAPLIVPGNPVRALLNVSEKLLQLQADSEVMRVIVWREEHTHPEVMAGLTAHVRALHTTIEQVLSASLRVPVAAQTLRAAVRAWAAIMTARPRTAVMSDASRDELLPVAQLICSGLGQHPAVVG
jgi:AcrR family transcriptional regulator